MRDAQSADTINFLACARRGFSAIDRPGTNRFDPVRPLGECRNTRLLLRRRGVATSAVTALCALLTSGSFALGSEHASGTIWAGSPIYDGLKGNQAMRSDLATVTGVGYGHPAQADTGAPGGDFVAIHQRDRNGQHRV